MGAELGAARELLVEETKQFNVGDIVALGALQAAGEDNQFKYAFLPQEKRYKELRSLGKRELIEAAKFGFEQSEKEVQRESKRAQKLEGKLERTLGGYCMKTRQA